MPSETGETGGLLSMIMGRGLSGIGAARCGSTGTGRSPRVQGQPGLQIEF